MVAATLIGKSARAGSLERLVASMTALHKQSYIKTIEGVANYSRVLQLEKISAPTHFVIGDEDGLSPPEMSRTMAQRIAGARLTVISGAGHLSNIEQPEKFNHAVLGFIRQHRRCAS